MQLGRVALTVAAVFLLAPSVGYSQERPGTGLVTGYPGAVGIIWHVSDRVAIRPDFSFSWSSTNLPGVSQSTYKNSRYGFGVNGLFYVRTIDNLRFYVSPRVSYTRVRSTSGSSGPTSTATGVHPSGLFGAQYSLHRRFAVYGEAGAGYSRLTSKSEGSQFSTAFEQKGHAWATVTAVGVIVYF
jgi:hypothetical protein